MKPWQRDLSIAGVCFVLDRITKLAASAWLDGTHVLVIPNTLRFSLSHNTGAMFGLARDLHDPWRTLLLVVVPIVAVVAISVFLLRIPRHEIYARTGLGLILGGALGNVLDRLVFGHVVDFIDVYAGWEPAMSQLVAWFGTNRWPTFNVADMGLVTGACLLMIEVFRPSRPAGDSSEQAPDAAPTPAEDDA